MAVDITSRFLCSTILAASAFCFSMAKAQESPVPEESADDTTMQEEASNTDQAGVEDAIEFDFEAGAEPSQAKPETEVSAPSSPSKVPDPFMITTARTGIAVSLQPKLPMYLGINPAGLEIFRTQKFETGLRVDAGLLSVSSPTEELKVSRLGKDLNSQAHAYGSSFLGVSVDKKSFLAYAGIDAQANAVGGARYEMPLSKNSELIADANIRDGVGEAGLFYSWSKNENNMSQSVRAGISTRGGDTVAGATYSMNKKIPFQNDGYLRTVFSASAASGRCDHTTSFSAGLLKDAGILRINGVAATLEIGVGVQVSDGKTSFGPTWKLGL